MLRKIQEIEKEIKKVLIGKEDIIKKVLTAICAGGHILLEDSPGVGKTTLALALSKTLDLSYKRVQFTPDTMPSDITGFTMYHPADGSFAYKAGAADCQLLLGDEINRTSPKTQAALLEVMEEGQVTVDGITHILPEPFICIATQNPYGAVGTQPLPDSQMDRFMVRLHLGYPTRENMLSILKCRNGQEDLEKIQTIVKAEEVKEWQNCAKNIYVADEVLLYMIDLCEATRRSSKIEVGISPRGIQALQRMSKSYAMLQGRDFVLPDDVKAVFTDTCAHRLILTSEARVEEVSAEMVLQHILQMTLEPSLRW